MAQSAGIQKVSYRHEAIIDWMLVNYDKPLGQCAHDLGYTQGWVSMIVHSDAFKMEYRRRREQHNEEMSEKARAKLLNIANKCLDKLEEHIDTAEELDPRFILDTADKTLHRYGFSPSKESGMKISVNGNATIVDGSLLNEARERIRQANALQRPRLIDGTSVEEERPHGGD